ncbi:hypothetical protein FJU08_09885 [Martelella alba]|uniref:Uncharacterized protein n=1 Tax=Martelella alba TaxID=2590451 RepID=A0A506UAM7_9HYPH|nr:hypothetical protein [Martelella alba]TPW30960.1 hypothetical protein FJU08_09885 [Martelella alba]
MLEDFWQGRDKPDHRHRQCEKIQDKQSQEGKSVLAEMASGIKVETLDADKGRKPDQICGFGHASGKLAHFCPHGGEHEVKLAQWRVYDESVENGRCDIDQAQRVDLSSGNMAEKVPRTAKCGAPSRSGPCHCSALVISLSAHAQAIAEEFNISIYKGIII